LCMMTGTLWERSVRAPNCSHDAVPAERSAGKQVMARRPFVQLSAGHAGRLSESRESRRPHGPAFPHWRKSQEPSFQPFLKRFKPQSWNFRFENTYALGMIVFVPRRHGGQARSGGRAWRWEGTAASCSLPVRRRGGPRSGRLPLIEQSRRTCAGQWHLVHRACAVLRAEPEQTGGGAVETTELLAHLHRACATGSVCACGARSGPTNTHRIALPPKRLSGKQK
jgi:hypothetical protein